MEKLSGLVLDVHDDKGAEVLDQLFPAGLPELIKSAATLTPELNARLPDDLFALVLHDGDVTLRKYACIDAGNTALSVEYFMKTAHKLPVEAQKTAAENLVTACGWYGIEPPEEIQKVALGLGTMLNLGLTAPGMAREAKANLGAIKGFGGQIVTPQQRAQLLGKVAEATGTALMPVGAPSGKSVESAKTVVRKVAGAVPPDHNLEDVVKGEQPAALPQSQALKPHVNVEGKEAPVKLTDKEAEFYALPSLRRYPLDSYGHVKEAAAYFDEWSARMSPQHRREFSVNLMKRASVLLVPVSPAVEKLASQQYAPNYELDSALDLRRNILTDERDLAVLDKIAEARQLIDADMYATLLGEFDKVAGIDGQYDASIPDPYASTFGVKEAGDSVLIGNDYLKVKQLKSFAKLEHSTIKYRFGEDFAEEFRKDPVGIFNSLPTDQKKVLARMATDNAGTDAESAAV